MSNTRPLPYQEGIRNYLKAEEPELWTWFSSQTFRAEYGETIRIEILKSAYRLDRETHAALYSQADDVLKKLGLAIPLTMYQSQLNNNLNASMSFLPGAAHLIFSGPVFTTLTGEELSWVMAHELGHYALLESGHGEFLVVDQILNALAADRRAEASHVESGRLYHLYTEIFADRHALAVNPDPLLGISALIKLATGIKDVNPQSYLAQAEEILSKKAAKTAELSHPEAFIRARALKLWTERGEAAEPDIARMIEGAAVLDELDLLGQQRLTELTRRILSRYFLPMALRCESLLGHARLFFGDFNPPTAIEILSEIADQKDADESIQRYLCYLLLDFAVTDPQLEDVPLAASIVLSRQLGLEEPFLQVVAKELKLKKKAVEKLRASAAETLAKAQGAP